MLAAVYDQLLVFVDLTEAPFAPTPRIFFTAEVDPHAEAGTNVLAVFQGALQLGVLCLCHDRRHLLLLLGGHSNRLRHAGRGRHLLHHLLLLLLLSKLGHLSYFNGSASGSAINDITFRYDRLVILFFFDHLINIISYL